MKGLGKFIVGGLLGAIFGFLISPKRAQKVRDALLGGGPGVSLDQPVRVAIPPAFQAAPSYREADASSLQAVPSPSFVVVEEELESQLEPETDRPVVTIESESTLVALVPAESSAAEPALPAFETTSSFTPGRTIEAQVLAALVGSSLTLVPPAAEESTDQEPTPVEEEAAEPEPVAVPHAPLQAEWTGPAAGAEPEVSPTPEVPEEAAWTGSSDSKADMLGPDSVAEDLEPAPMGVVEPEPETSSELELELELEPEVEVETLEVVEPGAPPPPRADPTDLRARIEDTRERIRRELELSFAARGQQEVGSDSESAPESAAEAEAEAPAMPSAAESIPRAADGSFDQEAMRRRIEETRNRLKAKAFDAMMSGESSLLSRDSGARQKANVAAPVPLDSEVAESIEKTLTEEEF